MIIPNTRLLQEEFEQTSLSPYASKSGNSKGREKFEEKCSIRTEYQRDRDRIIHSKAFRRLKHKTQMFISPEEDHYRTRLTHTLEVSQIARTAARALRLNEDLTEAIALGHDIGHTPFGHVGEDALDAVYAEYDPKSGFHHSIQSLRVVEKLERDGEGLNLTWEVRDGILHHSKGIKDLKLDETGLSSTLEGKLVRICDRVAYINHDIDDSIRAGMITLNDLPSDSIKLLGAMHSQRISNMVNDIINNSANKNDIHMSANMVEATNKLKDFLFSNVYNPLPRLEELNNARRIIDSLFRFYMVNINQLPLWLQPVDSQVESKARSVCDYVAGMTDRYALRLYEANIKNK